MPSRYGFMCSAVKGGDEHHYLKCGGQKSPCPTYSEPLIEPLNSAVKNGVDTTVLVWFVVISLCNEEVYDGRRHGAALFFVLAAGGEKSAPRRIARACSSTKRFDDVR